MVELGVSPESAIYGLNADDEQGVWALRNIVLDEELGENLFTYLSVIGEGFKLQGEENDVWLEHQKGEEVLWAKWEGRVLLFKAQRLLVSFPARSSITHMATSAYMCSIKP